MAPSPSELERFASTLPSSSATTPGLIPASGDVQPLTFTERRWGATMRSWTDWPPARAGVGASPDQVPFFVQGRSNTEVILTGFRVRVHERHPPLAGTLLGAACGDVGAFRWLEIDLDHNPPQALPHYDETTAQIAERFHGVSAAMLQPIRFPYKVSVSEAESFLVVAHTEGCDCSWDMELAWATQGRTGTRVINSNGTPFRTTSARATVGRCWLGTEVDCENA